jgi:predicted metal-dependent phosphoesterase TrpH
MLKVELHAHTADDPVDRIPYTTHALIDHVARAGYHALAVTLHDRQLDIGPLRQYAAARHVVLIPGIERTIEGCHVLLLNFQRGAADVRTFADLARLKASASGLVIAPHPFFPAGCSLGRRLEQHADLFDAVERNAMYTRTLDFNARAERWAARHQKPIVGAGDIHRLRQIDTTYSLVDAEPDAGAICRAIAAGRVRVESRPLTWAEAGRTIASLLLTPPRADRPQRQPAAEGGLWGVRQSADTPSS